MKTISIVSALSLALMPAIAQDVAAQDLTAQESGAAEAEVTFSEHVAPIIFNNCAVCHRPGEGAPFSLLNYQDARRRGTMIARVTQSKFMPPWHPVAGYGEFADSLALEQGDIDTLQKWVATGMQQGDPRETPPVPKFTDGWLLGEPDLVVSMPAGFEVPAGGPDIYRNFVVPVGLDEDKWLTAIEVRPGAPTVLHHALFSIDARRQSRRFEGQDGRTGFSDAQAGVAAAATSTAGLGGWAVGGLPRHLPLGLARRLPAGADLVLQSHLHPSGKKEVEKTTLGLYFTNTPPERTMVGLQLPPNQGFGAGLDIPPGDKAFAIRGSFTMPVAGLGLTVGGHAHYLCKEMKVNLTYPDGKEELVFFIDNWAFNWQSRYQYKEPLELPAGTKVDVEIIYDNSADNPSNPFNPPQRIRWGLQSTEEMGSVTMLMVAKDKKDVNRLQQAIRAARRSAMSGGGRQAGMTGILISRLRMADRNGDGNLDADELTGRNQRYLQLLDTNKDGVVDAKELEALIRR